MNTNDNVLEQIDHAFKDKKPSEIMMIYIAVAAIFGFISYQFVYPFTDKELKKTQAQLKSVQTKLNAELSYLKSKTVNNDSRFYVKKLKADIENLNKNLEKTKYENDYVDNKLRELSYLLFNDENWAKFLDNISYLAKKYSVQINYIKNRFNDINIQKVEEILQVDIDAKGKFNNIMNFINSLEESKLVVDIHNLHLEGKKGYVNVNLKISVWGMKY